ncbi:MAG TPA: pitrilysin family protein [Thermodesulfobacteriota bacterium]|nr:pitrilysin family protein [Thermodesulfobacteriota bacterium]
MEYGVVESGLILPLGRFVCYILVIFRIFGGLTVKPGPKLLGVLFAFLFFFPPGELYPFSLEGRVKEYTLDNGMKVLILERHQSPTLSLYIRFRVGAVDENLGRTGTAHLLEHMLFKGTQTLGTKNYLQEEKILSRIDSVVMAMDTEKAKGDKADKDFLTYLEETLKNLRAEHKKWVVRDEIEFLYSQNGAMGFNAMTSQDTTTYVVSLPSNRLELWARIESDRILHPVLRDFYSERDVVMEERRRSIDSKPGRKLMENFLAACFIAHPYGRPIIGWPSDIPNLEKRATEEFFRTFYSPANTVLALVGDLQAEEALSVVKRYFGRIPKQVLPPPLKTREPEQAGERRIQVVDDSNPQLIIGFHKPNPPQEEDAVCEIIEGILSSGRTSRLYRRLVEEEKIAVAVSASNGYPGERYANLFVLFATPRHPHTAEELEKAVLEEIDRLKSEPVGEEEMQKIKNQIQTEFLRKLDSNARLAYWLSYGQSLFGDWRYILERMKSCDKVTADDVRRIARKYFTARNRTVATLVKSTDSP